jgi:hypothetical protein
LGFPWLKGVNKAKVQAANCLYKFAAELVELCDQHGIPFTVVNPANSLMWLTPFFKPLMQKFLFHTVDACEYGSEHKKATGFLANFDAPRLKQRCKGDHAHKAWTISRNEAGEWKFDTAKEAEYPLKLARELAASFMDQLLPSGKFQIHDELQDHAFKVAAGSQPSRTRGPLLLSEYKSKVEVVCEAHEQPPASIPVDAQPPWQGIPIGAKLIDTKPVLDSKGGDGRLKAVYGVHFSQHEFMEKAKELRHPFDIPLPLDEANMSSIAFILSEGPAKVSKFRTDMLKYYMSRAKALQERELELHKNLDVQLQPVLQSKRLLLFQEMLHDAGVQDDTLFSDMCNGFRLVGDLQPSGQFQSQWRQASLGVEQLRQTAIWAQRAVVSSCKKKADDREVAEAVWAETLEQCAEDKQWVHGPFDAEQITQRQGAHWIPAKRFGVRQGGKIRPVDDFSQYLINATVSSHEKIDLEGIDNICATARFFLGASQDGSSWQLPTDEGVAQGHTAHSWQQGECSDLYGRCLDLKQAYKQLVRHPDDSWASVLAVLNPHDGQVYFFEATALPFGSISSVLAFNRAARALRTILAKLFKLVFTNFFDDFCQIELGLLTSSAWKTAELVMGLLGWKISTGEDKRRPFSKSFEILGAVVTFPTNSAGVIEVSNKETRLEQLKLQVQELQQCLGSSMSRTKIESLKGRLLYASGQTYGRCTQLACQILHRLSGMGPLVKISPELVHATSHALSLLLQSRPRVVGAWNNIPPVLIFTDGAAEEEFCKVTHGAVLLDPWSSQAFFFGDRIPEPFVAFWKRSGRKQVISQAEIFPVLVAKETWRQVIENRSILWFLDNDSARMALIRNYSPVLDNFCLLQLNAELDVKIPTRNWYSRVPSKSNPSDDASRLEFEAYSYAIQSQPCYAMALEALESFQKLTVSVEMG